MKPTIISNDKNHAFTRLNITDLETGRQRKHICYDADGIEALEFYRNKYADKTKHYVEEWSETPCTQEKMAL